MRKDWLKGTGASPVSYRHNFLVLIEILFILYEIKSDCQGSYDKQNPTLARGSIHKFHMKRPIVLDPLFSLYYN